MNLFWISWYQPGDDYRPIAFPPNEAIIGWWCTGYRCSDDAATICAMVHAESEEAAKHAVNVDWPEASEWRFCSPRDTLELSDRFPLSNSWMRERFEALSAAPREVRGG